MTDKEILDWMDAQHRGVQWNDRSGYWAVQDKREVAQTPVATPIRIAIEAVVNSEPVTES